MLNDRGLDRSQHKYKKTIHFDFFDYGPKYNFSSEYSRDELCDFSYKQLLQDYKEKVLEDVKKFGYKKAAEMWNCSNQLMIRMLKDWGIIVRKVVHKSELEKVYNELKDLKLVAKYFGKNIRYIKNKMSDYKLTQFKPERETYKQIKEDLEKQKELVDFYLTNSLAKTIEKYKLTEFFTIKILKANKVWGLFNGKHKIKRDLMKRNNGNYYKPYGEVI